MMTGLYRRILTFILARHIYINMPDTFAYSLYSRIGVYLNKKYRPKFKRYVLNRSSNGKFTFKEYHKNKIIKTLNYLIDPNGASGLSYLPG